MNRVNSSLPFWHRAGRLRRTLTLYVWNRPRAQSGTQLFSCATPVPRAELTVQVLHVIFAMKRLPSPQATRIETGRVVGFAGKQPANDGTRAVLRDSWATPTTVATAMRAAVPRSTKPIVS